MKHRRLGPRLTPLFIFLSAALVAAAPTWALDDDPAAGAQTASLETRANELEAQIEKECVKVAAPARPLCRKQIGQAVARLRDRAQRAQ